VCPLAKQSRLKFPLCCISIVHCFELIHFDILGPYTRNHSSSAKFFLTMVDDFSRSTWVSLMQHKSEVNTIIPYFFKLVEKKFHTQIQKIQSNNGREFFNSQTCEFLTNLGVLH